MEGKVFGRGTGQQSSCNSRPAESSRPDVTMLRAAIDRRLHSSAYFSEKNYEDQPILFTGRQLKSYTPEPIAHARAIARSPEMRQRSEAQIFLQQAQVLSDYEEDYSFQGHFSRYFPTYELMNNDQLRGYLDWRSRWRRGEAPQAVSSFIYLLSYELIHLVGVTDAQAGWQALRQLRLEYGQVLSHVGANLDRWSDDFVVYYGLDAHLLIGLAHCEQDDALEMLLHRKDHTYQELFGALSCLSSYRIEDSAFYKEHPDEVQRVIAKTYLSLADHHDRRLKHSLVQAYFGVSAEQDYGMFGNAVFADPRHQQLVDFEIDPLDHFRCRDGHWSRQRYEGNLHPNRKLGALLKTVDSAMRSVYAYGHPLQAPLSAKYITRLINQHSKEVLQEAAEARCRTVHIDRSKLGDIRAAADVTCERLIVDDEDETETETNEQVSVQAQPTSPVLPQSSAVSLSQDEQDLLGVLLTAGSVRDFERKRHLIASLLIDDINEKLYDNFGDIVIDADQNGARVIEDYVDDLKGMVGQ